MVEYHKERVDSFFTQFAQFDAARLDKSFFRVHENRAYDGDCDVSVYEGNCG